jgi:hypothetical protein
MAAVEGEAELIRRRLTAETTLRDRTFREALASGGPVLVEIVLPVEIGPALRLPVELSGAVLVEAIRQQHQRDGAAIVTLRSATRLVAG